MSRAISSVDYGESISVLHRADYYYIIKIIGWDVQGVKKPQIWEEVCYISCSHRPDMLFLTETMVAGRMTLCLISQFGFDNYDFVNPVNHSAGMWWLWNIVANVLFKEQALCIC